MKALLVYVAIIGTLGWYAASAATDVVQKAKTERHEMIQQIVDRSVGNH